MSLYKRKPKALGSVIDTYFTKQEHKTAFARGMVLSVWAECVGEAIARQTVDIEFKGDTLHVKVSSQAWRQEIFMRRHQIAQRLNKKVEADVVKSIFVKV